jgi:hypothetical protein
VVVFIKVIFQPIYEFELANKYKGTEDPQEHIHYYKLR